MQHEITASALLLDEKGNLREPGYAKRLLPIYSCLRIHLIVNFLCRNKCTHRSEKQEATKLR